MYVWMLAAKAVAVKVLFILRLGNQERGLSGNVSTCPMPAKQGTPRGHSRRASERDRGDAVAL